MAATGDVEGVLISGAYGTGKSSVAAELAETLEDLGVAYGAIDLDWLTWFEVPGMDRVTATQVYLANIADVVRNYRAAGVRRFVLAVAVRDRAEVRALEAAASMPLRVVRLELPLDEIRRRLLLDPTSGRRADLQVAEEWLAGSIGVGIEDLTVSNVGPIETVTTRILEWLGWIG